MQNPSYQFIKYVLTNLVEASTLGRIPAINFDTYSRAELFMVSVAHHNDSSLKFLEPILMRELHRVAEIAASDRLSRPYNRRRSMPPPHETTSKSGRGALDEKGRDGHSRLQTKTKKSRRGWRRNVESQSTSTGNVAKTNMRPPRRRRKTIDTCWIQPRRMRGVAWKKGTTVAKRKLSMARIS